MECSRGVEVSKIMQPFPERTGGWLFASWKPFADCQTPEIGLIALAITGSGSCDEALGAHATRKMGAARGAVNLCYSSITWCLL